MFDDKETCGTLPPRFSASSRRMWLTTFLHTMAWSSHDSWLLSSTFSKRPALAPLQRLSKTDAATSSTSIFPVGQPYFRDCFAAVVISFPKYNFHNLSAANLLPDFSCSNHPDTESGPISNVCTIKFLSKTSDEQLLQFRIDRTVTTRLATAIACTSSRGCVN